MAILPVIQTLANDDGSSVEPADILRARGPFAFVRVTGDGPDRIELRFGAAGVDADLGNVSALALVINGPSGQTNLDVTGDAHFRDGIKDAAGHDLRYAVDALVSNDSATPALVAGSYGLNGAEFTHVDTGITLCTFSTPFATADYHPEVSARDLSSGGAGICGAWVADATMTTITIGTWKNFAGSVTASDDVGFVLKIGHL